MPSDPATLPYGPAEFQAEFAVSRETMARLKSYADLLVHWGSKINLVGASTLPDLWRRHFQDSAQLASLIPQETRILVDLGSGAGFPGLVLALMQGDRTDFVAHLIEADQKKAAFLAAVAGQIGVRIELHAARIETVENFKADIVTARALAPLDRLFAHAARFWHSGTLGLFLKGRLLSSELTLARKSWRLDINLLPSRSDSSGNVAVVRNLQRAESA